MLNFQRQTYATCSECMDDHPTTELEILSYEEDATGRDTVRFDCPSCKAKAVRALVWAQ